jgi:hypothetical protein
MLFSQKDKDMSYFYEQLKQYVEGMGISLYKLHYIVEIPATQFSLWKHNKRRPSDTEIDKLARGLQFDHDKLMSWRLIDEYSEQAIRKACNALDEESD